MRTMLKIQLDNEAASRLIEDGSMPGFMEQMLGRLRPEAAYFGPEDGRRTAFVVFDLEDPSQLPAITEPMFNTLNAKVQMFPVMNVEDLQRGLAAIGDGDQRMAGSTPSM